MADEVRLQLSQLMRVVLGLDQRLRALEIRLAARSSSGRSELDSGLTSCR